VAGRLPDGQDDRPTAPRVAVISYRLWGDAFGGSHSIVGTRGLTIGTEPVDVIGVLAPDVVLPAADADVWRHSVLNPANWAANRSGHGLTVIVGPRRCRPAMRAMRVPAARALQDPD
jgi:hypothetical protein